MFRWKETENAAIKKGEAATGIEIFENLFYLYNLTLHGPLFLVNMAIISKEISLEKWQLLNNKWSGNKSKSRYGSDNLSLGYSDAKTGLQDFFWFLNPFTWIDLFWYFLFGWDLKDTYKYNPNDEEHYFG